MVMAPDRVRQNEVKAALAEMLGLKEIGFKHDATGTPTTNYAHGPGGVFSFPGVNPQVFSTTIGVESGMVGMLPKFSSVLAHPTFLAITGVDEDIGVEMTEVCDNAPTAGLMRSCKLTSVFGRYTRSTRELYLNRIGMRNDQADPTYLQLMNPVNPNLPGLAGDALLHPSLAPETTFNLNSELLKLFMEFGVSFTRLLARQLWLGNPANNSAAGEQAGYKELTGFDLLINTGKVDAETGAACAALDSDIKNFNFRNVDGSDLQTGESGIVHTLTYMYRMVRSTARKTGMLPATWAFAMREELFYELSAVWPCAYHTYRCTVGDNQQDRVVVDARQEIALRDDMRQNTYLLIDGIRVPVVFDDGIAEMNDATSANLGAGEFSSDIYLIPMTVLGGVPVTYLEYFDHTNPQLQETLNAMRQQQPFVTNAGAWIWNMRQTNLCLAWQGKVEPRLVLRTPQLAGRLQNVKYVPLQHTRTPFPNDPYFVNGGVTSRSGPSYFNEWQQ